MSLFYSAGNDLSQREKIMILDSVEKQARLSADSTK